MMTVKEVSQKTGVSIRTLYYYDSIALLCPTQVTESGYRLYDDKALERLQVILLFRELQFSLKEIKCILESPEFDRDRALEQQIELLTLRKEHIENLIALARGILRIGVNTLDFSAFDKSKIIDYEGQAKAAWGNTAAYREYEEKSKNYTSQDKEHMGKEMMAIFREFGALREQKPSDKNVQCLVGKLQSFITEHYYTCTPEILSSLGQMYAAGGSFTENIDKEGGVGTARLASEAIAVYCKEQGPDKMTCI
ncbi:MAG: MerR family transcriptional regulator [Lachnospiraceae bacterium]|jgi:DNA-binding transcriptional MerR regulator